MYLIENVQLLAEINSLGLYLPNQICEIENKNDNGFIIHYLNLDSSEDLLSLVKGINSNNSSPFYVQDDYDLGVFFDGWRHFSPNILTGTSDDPAYLFLIELDDK